MLFNVKRRNRGTFFLSTTNVEMGFIQKGMIISKLCVTSSNSMFLKLLEFAKLILNGMSKILYMVLFFYFFNYLSSSKI
jgi:hypothetical protein